jgi:hypothetical protein
MPPEKREKTPPPGSPDRGLRDSRPPKGNPFLGELSAQEPSSGLARPRQQPKKCMGRTHFPPGFLPLLGRTMERDLLSGPDVPCGPGGPNASGPTEAVDPPPAVWPSGLQEASKEETVARTPPYGEIALQGPPPHTAQPTTTPARPNKGETRAAAGENSESPDPLSLR